MKKTICLVILLSLLAISFFSCSSQERSFDLELRFLDVGQGDCTLLRTPQGDILVDTGPESEQDALIARLRSLDVERIKLLIVTHADEDHMGGADGILRAFSVDEVWTNGIEEDHETYKTFAAAISESKTTLTSVSAGQKYMLGNITLFVLAPFISNQEVSGNEGSIVFRLTFEKISAIFSGDAEARTEKQLLQTYGRTNLQCDLYKVGHHGSSTSTGEDFLKALSPQYAVISCGIDNSFGHPHGEILQRLRDIGTVTYRTDRYGEICFVTDGEVLTLHATSRIPETEELNVSLLPERKEYESFYLYRR